MKLKCRILVIVLIITAVLLISCDKTPANINETTPQDAQSTEAVASNDLHIIENGVCNYLIIRDEDSSQAATDAAVKIRKAIKALTGIEPSMTTDYKKATAVYDPSTLAILVGTTGYDETSAVMGTLGYGEYCIKVVGNKLVVAAAIDDVITKAAEMLCNELPKFWDDSGSKNMTVPAAYSFSEVTNKFFNRIPVYQAGILKGSYDAGDETKLMIITKTTAQEYTDYISSAVSFGYTVYDDNAINDNLFTTCTTSDMVLNVMYLPALKETRIIADSTARTALQPLDSDNKYTATVTSSLTQVGCEFAYGSENIADKQIGMCYIFRLADGSFIIEDGGFNNNNDANRIYNNLVKLNGSSKDIVIAAWIFSHTHGDHIGAFLKFSDNYTKQVKIERFIFNTPSEQQYRDNGYSNDAPADNLYTAMRKWDGAELCIAHPGQVYKIRNATLTVLHTYELEMPTPMSVFNSSSIVVTVELEGQKFFMNGDIYTDGSEMLARLYGNTLKSDFVQVSHHGAPGGLYATYKLIDATIVLWPLGVYDYFGLGACNRSTETYNRYFFDSDKVREIILAGSSVRTLELPYTYPEKLILPVYTK